MATERISTATTTPKTRIGRFFYGLEVPYGMAIVRVLMPCVLLLVMVPRWNHARELYSTDGVPTPLALNYGFHDFLPVLDGTVVVALASALVFFLVTSSIGWCTRFSLIAATVLYFYLNMLDSLSSITKYSAIAAHTMFLLCLSNCGAVWSVDAWLKKRRQTGAAVGQASQSHPLFPVWPRRLLQLLVGLVYFGAALTKMHTPQYFSSDQLRFWMLTNVNNENPFGEYLSLFPAMLVMFAYIAIVWEILFLFLAWKGWWRPIMLVIGVGFHVMTTFTLGLYIFPLVCISTYFSFVEKRDVQLVSIFLRRLRRRWLRQPRAAQPIALKPAVASRNTVIFAYSISVMLAVLVGVEAEYLRDPYGIRQANGPHELKVLDKEHVKKMMSPGIRIREADKFLSFDVGTQVVGGVLFDHKYTFQQGDCLIAQCSLTPPHEDMWVECNLHDTDDHVLDRTGMVVSRDMLRANFYYTLGSSLPPGEYHLVVKSAGREVSRRRLTLEPGDMNLRSAVAN